MNGFAMALLSMFFFSAYLVLGKMLVSAVDPAILIIFVQMIVGLVLIIALDLTKKIKEITSTSRDDFKFIAVVSVLSSAIAPMVLMWGMKMTSASNAVLLSRGEAVFASFLAVMMLNERVTIHQLAGAAVMFLGIFMIATDMMANGLSINPGDGLVLLSGVLYACSTVLFKKHLYHVQPEVIVTLRNVIGSLVLLAASPFIIDFGGMASAVSLNYSLWMMLAMAMAGIAGQMLWYRALETTTIAETSVSLLISPAIGLLYAWVLLGEAIGIAHIAGGLLIVAGLGVMQVHFSIVRPPHRHKHNLRLRFIHSK